MLPVQIIDQANPTAENGVRRTLQTPLRIALYLYVLLIACPIRYFPVTDGTDATWLLALNYAHTQGLAMGRDIVFTCGPLVYLIFPQHMGTNLKEGLLFESALWIVMAAIFADVFFVSRFRLRNLALFSFCFGLSAPLFWFSVLGPENLMLAGALILLVTFHFNGGWPRFLCALALIGLLPLFKLAGAVIGAAALAGFLLYRLMTGWLTAIREIVLAALIPVLIAVSSLRFILPSWPAFWRFLRGSVDIMAGYSTAMSSPGRSLDFLFALDAAAVLIVFLWLQFPAARHMARFFGLFVILPLFISFKHGFVRQDYHISAFFCFAALSMALISLPSCLRGETGVRSFLVVGIFFVIWEAAIVPSLSVEAIYQSIGLSSARVVLGALPWKDLGRHLDASSTTESPLEPDLMKIIGDSPVASLSVAFTNLAAAGLRLKLYPTLQRDASYSAFLDQWNAGWVRDYGPRFLIFDGGSIDERLSWVETPAMWLEIYRWYDTRALASRNLLLERRDRPRFATLAPVGSVKVSVPGDLAVPASQEPVFWNMSCSYSARGSIEKVLFRVPPVTMSVHEIDRATTSTGRVSPEMLVSPVLGNYLPGTLSEYAELFQRDSKPTYSVDRIRLDGPGISAYSRTCEGRFFRLVN